MEKRAITWRPRARIEFENIARREQISV